jgi:hypothetical protein
MKLKTNYPDHPELFALVLEQLRDTPIAEYDVRVERYEKETDQSVPSSQISPQKANVKR